MEEATAELRALMALQTGDEKHAAAADSTLDVLHVLYEHVLRVDPGRPDWEERDRFLLSKGHGPMAFYAVLARKGFFPRAELSRFMRWDGRLGGHPDRNRVPGVESSSGSLGHGLPMALGVAYALGAKRLHGGPRVFVLVGDGELNEGSNWEAILHAGARRVPMTLVVVDNASSSVELGDIAAKLAEFGWDAAALDGRDHDALRAALSRRPPHPVAVVAQV